MIRCPSCGAIATSDAARMVYTCANIACLKVTPAFELMSQHTNSVLVAKHTKES